VVTPGRAQPLVRTTAAGWGERDFIAAPSKDPDDLAGPVAIAALGGAHRVIAVASAESAATARLAGGGSAVDLWLARAIRFAAGSPEAEPAAARRPPDQIRLVISAGQRRAVIALCVGGIPLAWALLGGLAVVWRRGRGR
jgi:hypothetical protein